MNLNRRKFVKKASLLGGSMCTGLVGLTSGCTPVTYLEATVKDNTLQIEKSLWGEADFVLVKNPRLKAPIYLRKQGSDYTALSLECTHKQCEVRPSTQLLRCPCHGSEFDQHGKVLNGPAEEDLLTFNTRHDANHIYIL